MNGMPSLLWVWESIEIACGKKLTTWCTAIRQYVSEVGVVVFLVDLLTDIVLITVGLHLLVAVLSRVSGATLA